MKIDFTKLISFLKEKKLPLFLFVSAVGTFFLFNLGYVLTVKKYELLFINFAFGLVIYIAYEIIIGKKLYYTKLNIDHSNNRKNKNISDNINCKEGKDNTK